MKDIYTLVNSEGAVGIVVSPGDCNLMTEQELIELDQILNSILASIPASVWEYVNSQTWTDFNV